MPKSASDITRPAADMRRAGAEAGFSVLEALIAMAVLAGALLPLLALQGQFLRTTESLERTEIRLAVEDIALAHIKALNLDQAPNGDFTTPYGQMRWTSSVASGPAPAREASGFPSRYVVTLYNVEIQLSPTGAAGGATGGPAGVNSGQYTHTFKLQGLGWHPTQSILDSL